MGLLSALPAAWRRSARSAPATPPTVAPAPASPSDEPGWVKAEQAIMGTAISAELWCEDPDQAQAALAAVMAEMHRIDAAMSPHKPASELSRINREAAEHAVPLSEEMAGLIARALRFSELSSGAFDISYASAGQLYDYRAGTAPSDAALAPAREAIGHRGLLLDRANGTLRFARPGMRIDLGGFAKGHAVDNAIALLKARGIRHAMVAAGGDSHLLGDRRGRPWMVAVRDPRQAGANIAVLPLQDVAISTSGDYERFFIAGDGRRHHHLLDPRTGRSAEGVQSVTILADDGLTTEALSKAVFVLGAAAGLKLIDTLPGVDAVIVDGNGQLHFSGGLRQAGH
ncbi:MAG TPA: FAD:protein FMN transferase [Ideonella sp.]|uniref:FAD:protein FMN transferase n=1 Tax=Ideonella sp. TaxID=1929293 RepID=UPI002CB12407|nr:FAD:protein FMN transferase [Ideonella sp.]HSI51386.1 FAD:protein FMN transferase [Ideonella sp.]